MMINEFMMFVICIVLLLGVAMATSIEEEVYSNSTFVITRYIN